MDSHGFESLSLRLSGAGGSWDSEVLRFKIAFGEEYPRSIRTQLLQAASSIYIGDGVSAGQTWMHFVVEFWDCLWQDPKYTRYILIREPSFQRHKIVEYIVICISIVRGKGHFPKKWFAMTSTAHPAPPSSDAPLLTSTR